MSFISITNTFASATLIESGKVNQNFVDFKTGLSDGLHDVSMAAGVFNQPLLIASGTTATPGLAYKNSPTTGLYSPATDINVFVAAGNEVGRIGSAGTWAIGANGLVASHNVYGHTNFHDGFTIVSGVAKVASGLTITSGDLDVDGSARIRSNVTIASGGLYVDGPAKIKSTVTMTEGPLTVDGPASFKSAVTVSSGYMTVDGPASFKSAVTISSGNMFLDGYEDFKKIATPASASAGTLKLHAETDNQFYATTEDGIRYPIGAGSGSGTKNYVTNPSGKVSTTGWTAIDGNITIASDYTTAVPRYTTTGAGLKLVSSVDEKYVYYRFLLDDVDVNKKLGLNLAVSIGVASQYRVEMWKNDAANYGGTYTEIALKTDVSGDSYLPVGGGVYQSSFDTDTVPYMELRIVHNGTDNTAAYFSDVTITPDPLGQGAVVTDWVSYTPTGSWTTNATYTGKYRRVGSNLELTCNVILSGSPSEANGQFELNLPNSLTVDPAVVTNNRGSVGYATYVSQGAGYIDAFVEVNNMGAGNNKLRVLLLDTVNSSAHISYPLSQQNNHPKAGLVSGDELHLTAYIPIAEWAGSGTLNVADTSEEYASNSAEGQDSDNTTSFAYGLSGSYIPRTDLTLERKRTVRFVTPIQATDILMLEIKDTTGYWHPIVGGVIRPNGTNGMDGYFRENSGSDSTGVGIVQVLNSSDISISFGRYRTGTSAWSSFSGADIKWRVRKSRSIIPVGFGYQVPGVSSGLMRKEIGTQLSVSTATAINTGGDREVASLTLTEGKWSVSASLNVGAASGQTNSEGILWVKGVNGRGVGGDYFNAIVDGVGQWCSSITFPTRVVDIASGDADKTIKIYERPYGANTTGTGTIYAIRVGN